MGQAEMLFGFAREIADVGTRMTRESIKERLEATDHPTKQRLGGMGTTLRATRGTRLGDTLMTAMQIDHADAAGALAEVNEVVKAKRKRDPNDRHNARMRALYVDLTDTGWTRPASTEMKTSANLIQDAVNDYTAGMYDGVNMFERYGPTIGKSLDSWRARFPLPPPPGRLNYDPTV